ncbi:adhesion G protein-coupled receptor F5 isoform X1 [Octodon degus]|uniref:Adhesion G protein-coupled receptor F5 isoform X1 n=1 Tax=Octodon degus TaxID=10160 RepID=A0A6P6ERP5_OCTDE|nr:adhesion G protein-coupled receptor F5 isoform X1 [Octodon degus]XP_023574999.1 adhesion G protein-coupled receptor F5 isoform X1 [Octodon degus]XP_023575007.1 adhesion G protein-coupled receptor F5 isoform X1 [Octodon degus]
MHSPRRSPLCLVLLVTCLSRAQSWDLQAMASPSVLRERDFASVELLRSRRAAALSNPVLDEHTVDIEIGFENVSFLEHLKAQLRRLSFPIQAEGTAPTTDILSMEVTTVCTPSGNELWCSCESGYEWPRETCIHNTVCQEHGSVTSGNPCSCLKGLPPQGPFCQRPKVLTLKMKVRLNVGFQEDLLNTSSALYRSYKTDLERAFQEGYRNLSGFQSVTVKEFTKGSVVVSYELKTTTLKPAEIQKANSRVLDNLNQTYKVDESSFQGVNNETKITTIPAVIFEGDEVVVECENEALSTNVSWFYGKERSSLSMLQNSSRYCMYTTVQLNSVSRLTIHNFTQEDAGLYACKLVVDIFEFANEKRINVTPFRILANETAEVKCDNSPVSLRCCSERKVNWSTIEWKQEDSVSIPGHKDQDLDSSCSRYTLQANRTHCPATVNYTCEFSSGYGARGSKTIEVTFIPVGDNSTHKGEVHELMRHTTEESRHTTEVSTVQSATSSSLATQKAREQPAKLTITPDPISVSEGQSFSIKCTSNVRNYEDVYWNTSAGIKIHKRFYATREHPGGTESVLTVQTSTREWNGTYHCIFQYKNTCHEATKDVTVHPLPLEPNIMVDPLEASGLCSDSHHFRCCVEEDENYTVMFEMESSFFPAAREVQGKQVCYKYSSTPSPVSQCPKNIDVFCHFTNAANSSVRSSSMKLSLVPEENVTCNDPVIGVGEPGKVIQKLCQFSDARSTDRITGGIVTYRCVGSQWQVERKGCISAPINDLLQLAEALIKSPSQDQNLPKYLKNLSLSTGREEQEIQSSPGSLGAVINILDLLSTVPTQVNPEMMKDVLATVNIVLGKSVLGTWEALQQDQTSQSSQLLHSVERFSKALRPGDGTFTFLHHPNVQMGSMAIKPGNPHTYQQNFHFPDADLWGNVTIERHQLGNLPPEALVVSVAFPTLKAILTPDAQKKPFANSLVMTTTISHNTSAPFEISMSFKHNHRIEGQIMCVFWNFSLSNHTGGWDSRGCRVNRVDRDSVSCTCDHLTSFSILMSPDSPDRGSLLEILLDIISYIGLGFSILSLAACLVVEAVVWKSVTKNRTSYMRHVCIVNIAASLLFADAWFIVAAAIQEHRYLLNNTACVAATFFIHFFYLSVFFWMLTLGLMLFYRLVFILHDASKSMQKAVAFCLGYGCPLVISVITVAATQPQEVYMRKNACWLNWEDTKALLAFVIPALIIVVVNMTITVVVITKILRPSIGDKPNKQEKNSLFQISKSIGVLTPLLGLTWGFGLATVFQGSNAVFHIIFTLLNAFQGLFILLFGCLWDQKVQEALLNKFLQSRRSSQHSKSTSLASTTPVFSMSSPISRRFNNLFGKTGTYNVSTPETTSSSVENSSSAYSLLR